MFGAWLPPVLLDFRRIIIQQSIPCTCWVYMAIYIEIKLKKKEKKSKSQNGSGQALICTIIIIILIKGKSRQNNNERWWFCTWGEGEVFAAAPPGSPGSCCYIQSPFVISSSPPSAAIASPPSLLPHSLLFPFHLPAITTSRIPL